MALSATAQNEAPTVTGSQTVAVSKGDTLMSADGGRLGAVYRVNPDGSVQLIFEGKFVTIPASTLSMANGKLTTSLSKRDVTKH